MVESLLRDVVAWAAGEPRVTAVALVGSHARGEARPDSDVDLLVLAGNPRSLVDAPGWLERFGEVARRSVEDWGRVTSLRVAYRAGAEVEFALAAPDWATRPDAGTHRVVRDGLRVLWDPEGVLAGLAGQGADGD